MLSMKCLCIVDVAFSSPLTEANLRQTAKNFNFLFAVDTLSKNGENEFKYRRH